jgi:hypothetical protein
MHEGLGLILSNTGRKKKNAGRDLKNNLDKNHISKMKILIF